LIVLRPLRGMAKTGNGQQVGHQRSRRAEPGIVRLIRGNQYR
jgi:hypothetical protein